jgi:hypothetical protein
MNTIIFGNRQKKSIKIASCWEELTSKQFIEVVKHLPKLATENFPNELLRVLLGINKKLFAQISAVQKYHIQQAFDFLKGKPEMKKLLIQSFKIKRKKYVGYMPAFSNTTWEEFIFADQYFMNNQFLHAIAVLYRERKKRKKRDGQSDIRIPFSIYGTSKRLEKITALDGNTVAAIVLNYQVLREKNISEKYPHIFSFSAQDTADKSFSWVNVHRNILSEYFFEEEKFLKSNLHAVLHRMNNLIAENKKKKK